MMPIARKFSRFGRAFAGLVLPQRGPVAVRLNVTDRCTLKCSYCNASIKKAVSPDPPTHTLLDLIDALGQAAMLRALSPQPWNVVRLYFASSRITGARLPRLR